MIELQVLGNDAIPLNVTETSTIPLEVTMSTGGGDITVEALSVTANGTYTAPSGKAYSPVEVDVEPNLQTLSKTITPSLNTIIRDYTPDSGYDGLAEVFVTVMPIELGTAGTPTASKGSVSNHSVAVTPSVTNTTGYIEGGTKTGTAVTVSASELVSGTKSITENGTGIDVTNYASVDVAVPSTTPTGTISITQNGTTDVTNYASANVNVPNSYSASDEGKVVSSGALVSQTSDSVTQNGTVDTTLINSLTVNVSGGGTNYGTENARTILGLIYALEHNTYHTGTVTVSSYFPTNTESEFCDTGYGETSNIMIWIVDTAVDINTSSTERLFQCLGVFAKPETSGSDFSLGTAFGFERRRGSVETNMFGNRMNSYRVNNGKLYINPKYAQTNYTYFVKNATYRWFAVPYSS